MSVESALVGYYAQRAREYERIYQKPERQSDLRLLRKKVPALLAGKEVLEVACGTGYWTEALAKSAVSVLATDINDEVLEIARAKLMPSQNVAFQKVDAYKLPAFPRSFSAGLTAFWWSHVPKTRLREFLLGFHRCLAANATVVFVDNVYVEGSSTSLSHRDADGNTYQRRSLDNGTCHDVLKNFPTKDEIAQAIKGLAANVNIEFLTYYWILTYVVNPRAMA